MKHIRFLLCTFFTILSGTQFGASLHELAAIEGDLTDQVQSEISKILINDQGDLILNNVDGEGRTPVYIACRNGNIKIAEFFLNNGADVDKARICNFTPLHVACDRCNPDIVKLLLSYNSNVNSRDMYKRTPLNILCKNSFTEIAKKIEIAKLLLEKGANIDNQDDEGLTPLFGACTSDKNIDLIKFLLEKGANVNVRDKKIGQTPLFLACRRRDFKTAKLLLDYGADVNIKDFSGTTVLEIIYNFQDHNNLEIANDILKCGFLTITPLMFKLLTKNEQLNLLDKLTSVKPQQESESSAQKSIRQFKDLVFSFLAAKTAKEFVYPVVPQDHLLRKSVLIQNPEKYIKIAEAFMKVLLNDNQAQKNPLSEDEEAYASTIHEITPFALSLKKNGPAKCQKKKFQEFIKYDASGSDSSSPKLNDIAYGLKKK